MPAKEIQELNCFPQAALHARVSSSNVSSSTMNSPVDAFPTAGGRLPMESVNSKKVVISTTAIVAPELDFPVTLFVETAELTVLEDDAALVFVSMEEVVTSFPLALVVALLVVLVVEVVVSFPFPPLAVVVMFELVVLVVLVVDVVVPFPFPPLAVVVVFELVEIDVDVTSFPAALVVLVVLFELDAVDETMKSGPSETAKAAAAAAANPPDPSLEAALAVVPVPMTVNLVQSSADPR